jgi:LysM repeat protein
MRFSTLSIVSMAAVAAAFPSGSDHHFLGKRASCESTTKVEFHFNDTSIGTLESCTTDVTNRGGDASAVTKFRQRDNTPCVSGPLTEYVVIPGDTLEKIALQFNSGVCNIASVNRLSNPDFILAGQTLVVPTEVCPAEVDNQSCRTAAGTATCVRPGPGVSNTYTIVAGDTFFLVSSRLGITLDSLVAANPGVNPGALQIGQVINVPICPS